MQQGDHVRIGTEGVSVFTIVSVDEDAHSQSSNPPRTHRASIRSRRSWPTLCRLPDDTAGQSKRTTFSGGIEMQLGTCRRASSMSFEGVGFSHWSIISWSTAGRFFLTGSMASMCVLMVSTHSFGNWYGKGPLVRVTRIGVRRSSS